MSKRKQTEEYIIKYINELVPGGDNKKLYEDKFSQMSDEEFDQFMNNLKDGKERLCIVSPNFSKNQININNAFRVGDLLKHDFFKRVWVPATKNTPKYLTPKKYLILTLPIRLQAQLLDKKISVAEHNNTIDNLTGQPTGDSKGSKISYPELQVLVGLGLKQSLIELTKFRGGDLKAFNAMNALLSRNGGVAMNSLGAFSGIVKSTHTLKVFLTGMHLNNNLTG
jgi:hypothetical protein